MCPSVSLVVRLSGCKRLTSPINLLVCSPFKFRVLPTHDASKVRASGPGLTSGVPASLPVEFNIDAKDAGQGQLSVLITVSEAAQIHCDTAESSLHLPVSNRLSSVRTKTGNPNSPASTTTATARTGCRTSPTARDATPSWSSTAATTSPPRLTGSAPRPVATPASAPSLVCSANYFTKYNGNYFMTCLHHVHENQPRPTEV